jgi:predicted dithiol-disulfide oxidoreductase (DUF899 family)
VLHDATCREGYLSLTETMMTITSKMNLESLRQLIVQRFRPELDALRIGEKAHTHQGDAIAAVRRRLPWSR